MNKIQQTYNICSYPLMGIFFLVLLLFNACTLEDGATEYLELDSLDCRSINMGAGEERWENSSPYGIDSIWLENSCLSFNVAFTGGCQEHSFSLWWNDSIDHHLLINGVYNEDAPNGNIVDPEDGSISFNPNINKVPVLVLYLVHDDLQDDCEALVRSSHSFNIEDLQQTNHSEVLLEVHSTDKIYSYQYRWK